MLIAVGAFILAFAVIVVKLVDLQVLNPDAYAAYVANQRVRTETLAADRGAIVDRNGEVLALSVPAASVYVDPGALTDAQGDPHAVALRLAEAMVGVPGADAATIEAKLRSGGRFAYIARQVDDAVAAKVKALVATMDASDVTVVPGVGLLDEPRRAQPAGEVARSLVGRSDPDGHGIGGVEQQYDHELTGTPGKVSIERDPGGRTIASADPVIEPAIKGDDVMLTIDRSMQYEAEHILAEQVLAAGAKSGVAIVMKPDTGEVLAMANVTVDDTTGQASTDLNNAALTTVYEPGSVMKIVAASAALEHGKVNPDTKLQLPPTIKLCDYEFGEAESRGAVEWSVRQVLTESSNVGTIQMADKVGKQGVYDMMRAFGFGQKSAIGFPNEQSGRLPAPKDWDCASRGSIPIGQGVSVTPLQMLSAYNVIANAGVYVAPKLVGATIDGQGNRVDTPVDTGHRVISKATADQMNVMLRDVVLKGTGTQAAITGYAPAGKTGTARIPQPGGGYIGPDGVAHYEASFVGFVPAEAPALSVLVKINDPSKKGIFGGVVAAPAFSKIGAAALRRFGVTPPTVDLAQGGIATRAASTPGARVKADAATAPTTTTTVVATIPSTPSSSITSSSTVTTSTRPGKTGTTAARGSPPTTARKATSTTASTVKR